jgi:4-aminobutyrate aminotransferase
VEDSIGAIERVLRTVAPPEEVAAIIFEPVQGEGGYLIPPRSFYERLQALARKHGILTIADEVQSGMGRTGRMFACEHFGMVPDIINTAKGIASGLPISAMIARAEIMDWTPGAHASTFGGNPVACAAALATIELLESGLMDNARRVGDHILSRLKRWPERFPNVGDVRGLGLMIGIELVTDRASKEKAHDLRDRVVDLAFRRGVLVLGAGESTIRLSPPLIVTREQADFAIDVLEQCLEQAAVMPAAA